METCVLQCARALAAVYTNIENLPFIESNTHGWIEDARASAYAPNNS